MMKVSGGKILLTWFVITQAVSASGQNSRYRPIDFSDSVYQVSVRKMIVPLVLAGYGFAQFSVAPILDLNLRVRSEITDRVKTPCRIDNYTQYAPAAAVYGLNLMGISGKHNLVDRSVILATSGVIMGISVVGFKQLTHIQRPDGSTYNSFPSGHTATAFACAEFLFQEFKDRSLWYGVAGYAVAAGTGFLRMYNNRHWLTDVVAGAGFGILSTKVAYWLFPRIKKQFFKDFRVSLSVVPYMDPRHGQVQ